MVKSTFRLLCLTMFFFIANNLMATEYPTVKIGGFVASQFVYDESKNIGINSQWKFKHARMHVKGNISDNLNGFVQIETKTGSVSLQNAFINLMYLPNTEIRAGYIKLPFGLEAYGHPLKNPTIDISLVSKKIYCPIGVHDMGVHLKYKHQFATVWIAGVNGNNGSTSDNNRCKDFCGRLILIPVKGLGIGGSYYMGKRDTTELASNRYGVEVNYKNGTFWVRGEYLGARDEQFAGDDKEYMGYYAAFTYRFLPQIEGVAKYDAYDPDLNVANNGWTNITIGLSYYLTEKGWSRVSLNYEMREDKTDENLGNLLTTQLQVLF